LEDTLAKRVATLSIKGAFFNFASSAYTLGLGFARSVLLARLLAPEDFGAVTLALFFLSLIGHLVDFGFAQALVQRREDVERAAATHFALNLGVRVLKMIAVLLMVPFLRTAYREVTCLVPALLALMLVDLGRIFTMTPSAIMTKNLDFRRLAVLDVMCSTAMTVVALTLAWLGFGFWSLIGEQASGVLTRAIGLWLFFRPWKLQWHVDWSLVRWYFQFGTYLLLTKGLSFTLDQFDDFWAGTALGATALGFYSKAYEFARYPRRVIANPIMGVFYSTYARVQDDRDRLSKTFFRVNSLVVRAGFLFSGAFALVAPEFVRLFPGDKWMPMVTTFRLMLVYTLIDPLVVSAGNLATAVGQPRILTRARALQVVVFIPLVILLARYYAPIATQVVAVLGWAELPVRSIDGIAIAADVMLLLGIVLVFRSVRPFVDFSLRRMFAWPLAGLLVSLAATFALERSVVFHSDWLALVTKGAFFSFLYAGGLLLTERKEYVQNLRVVLNLLQRHGKPQVGSKCVR
jgi:O-antigen/teichoic acid export membrane protein